MLLDLRERVRNSKPIKYTLITIICIPFALVGIGSYFSGGTAAPVAEVNGQPIDQQQLERAYQQQRQQLARMFGGQLPEAFANEGLLRQQALQQLITQQVLESEVAKQQFAVGDATLGRAIRNLPNFQIDGQFDSSAYQTQLRASGMSVPAFEQSFRDDTALNQFRVGVSDTNFVLPNETQHLTDLQRQTRTIDAVRFSFLDAKDAESVSDEDVANYFNENSGSFEFPQRAKIRYLELSEESLASDIEVSSQQAQTYYEENRASFVLPEQREASHILLSADEGETEEQIAQLQSIKSRITAGESFAELAKEFSDDVGSADSGGSLGVITPGAMVPAFEEAVFALQAEGEISPPVVTEFGVHLIQLDKITPESGKPFEEVQQEIITIIQQDEADSSYFELRELLTEYSFDNPGSLEPAAEATGLEIKTSDWLDIETLSDTFLNSTQVLNAVFSEEVLDNENNSELIEVAPRHVIVLRVAEHEDPRPKSLDDVKEQIADVLKTERANEYLKARQAEALLKLAEGMSVVDLAESEQFGSAIEQEVLERTSTTFDRTTVRRIFALSKPDNAVITEAAALTNGDLLALRLVSVQVPPAAEDDAADNQPTSASVDPRDLGGTDFEVLLEGLRNAAKIDIKNTVLP